MAVSRQRRSSAFPRPPAVNLAMPVQPEVLHSYGFLSVATIAFDVKKSRRPDARISAEASYLSMLAIVAHNQDVHFCGASPDNNWLALRSVRAY